MKKLILTSPAFAQDGFIPKKHTGFGEDCSPELRLSGIDGSAVSVAVLLEDLDVPFTAAYPHWIIWNLPAAPVIPEGIPYGADVPGGAVQGVAYGKNRYRGPKQPFFITAAHRYVFRVYTLDKKLELPSASGKKEFLAAMDGHILQTAELMGVYKK